MFGAVCAVCAVVPCVWWFCVCVCVGQVALVVWMRIFSVLHVSGCDGNCVGRVV